MKKNDFLEAMGNIDASLIERADRKVTMKSRSRITKIAAIAASFAVLIIGFVAVLPMLIGGDIPMVWENVFDSLSPVFGAGEIEDTGEMNRSKYPIFDILDEKYASYLIRNAYPIGKTDEFIGEKIDEIEVMNAWNYFDQYPQEEHDPVKIKAEVYLVKGVALEAGVAIKFIEQGSFNSTELYYAAVNTDYEFTSFADFIADYNAPVHMAIAEEVIYYYNDPTYKPTNVRHKNYVLKNAVNDEICKILLTLDAPAEVTSGYGTNDERIAACEHVIELRVMLASGGDNYNNLWVHDNGYIAYAGFRQGVAFFNVGKEATDAIFKLFDDNKELVSVCVFDRAIGKRVDIPASEYVPE